ncbi:MAG: hypothetical protein U1E65_28885 [Myxococcota bacterium]
MRLAPCVALALCGCESVAPLDASVFSNAKAVLLVLLDRDGVGQKVLAIDAENDAYPSFSSDLGGDVYALTYSCNLQRLGLSPGSIELEDQESSTALLPPQARRFVLPASVTAWTPAEVAPAAIDKTLRHLPLPPQNPCRAAGALYTSENLDLDNDGRDFPAFAVPIDDERVFAGSGNGALYEVHAHEYHRRPDLEGHHFKSGYRAQDRSLWMVDAYGQIWHGHPDRGFQRVTTSSITPTPKRNFAMAGPDREGVPFELYFQAYDGDEAVEDEVTYFARFDGTRTEVLSRARRPGVFLPAVAWVGPGEAVAIGAGTSTAGVVRYQGGQVRTEILPGIVGPASITQHPSLGTLVGRDSDGVSYRTGDTWHAFDDVPVLYYIRVMRPEGPGFLLGGSLEINFSASGFTQYQPTVGFCQAFERYTPVASVHFANLGPDKVVATTVASFVTAMGISVLSRQHEAGSCSEAE